jgi:hypothetical protein
MCYRLTRVCDYLWRKGIAYSKCHIRQRCLVQHLDDIMQATSVEILIHMVNEISVNYQQLEVVVASLQYLK